MEADFPADPEAWDLRARRCLSPNAPSSSSLAHTAATAVYEQALAATVGPQMFDLYLAFLNEQLKEILPEDEQQQEGGSVLKLRGEAKQLAKQILQARLLLCGVL